MIAGLEAGSGRRIVSSAYDMDASIHQSADTASVLRRAVTRLARRLRAERPHGALSPAEVGVLAHLYGEGPSTPGQVSTAEHQRPQSLTRVFAQLERSGLISRAPSPRDRRASLLMITPTGTEALKRDMSQRDAWLTGAIAELGETEIELLRIAAIVIDKLADAAPAQQPRKTAA